MMKLQACSALGEGSVYATLEDLCFMHVTLQNEALMGCAR